MLADLEQVHEMARYQNIKLMKEKLVMQSRNGAENKKDKQRHWKKQKKASAKAIFLNVFIVK